MMHAKEFSTVDPQHMGGMLNYLALCRTVGLEPIPGGYGFMHCLDDDGAHWTLVTTDLEFHKLWIARMMSHHPRAVEEVVGKYSISRAGWPDEWSAPR